MNTPISDSHLTVAKKAAIAAGQIHLKYFQSEIQVETKEHSYDLVTIADKEAEEEIVRILKESFPDHNFLGEEEEYESTDSEYQWIIDPLDGTNNFSSGFPIFSVSIALYKNKKPLIGCVFDPTRNEFFHAISGQGAFLNDNPIQVSDTGSLNQSLLITGFYYDRGEMMIRTLDQIKDFFEKDIIGIRRLGSAALDLCSIAAGRATGYWELQLSPWDFAAGRLIVQEAGGMITDTNGKNLQTAPSPVVASNGRIHKDMLSILQRH